MLGSMPTCYIATNTMYCGVWYTHIAISARMLVTMLSI